MPKRNNKRVEFHPGKGQVVTVDSNQFMYIVPCSFPNYNAHKARIAITDFDSSCLEWMLATVRPRVGYDTASQRGREQEQGQRPKGQAFHSVALSVVNALCRRNC